MTYRPTNQSASICAICGQLFLLTAVVGQGVLCRGATAQPHVLKWNIEATVYSKADPHKVFPDVRLGDKVRGTLAYNCEQQSLWDDFFFGTAYYFHGATFPLTEMVVENPRTGVDLEFKVTRRASIAQCTLRSTKARLATTAIFFYTEPRAVVPVPVPDGT